jgi:hypothetical protein
MAADLFDEWGENAGARGGLEYRWSLWRRWADGPVICWIGLNPSTADAKRDDPTTRRWTQFTRAWGYAGFVAVNLYPLRASQPRRLYRWVDGARIRERSDLRADLEENLRAVTREAKAAARVIACWGAKSYDGNWTEQVIAAIQSGEPPHPAIWCLGRTASREPVHPMARGRHRVPDDALPVLWREA